MIFGYDTTKFWPPKEVHWYPSDKSPAYTPQDIRDRLRARGYVARIQHSADGYERVLLKDRNVDLRFKTQDGFAVSAVLVYDDDTDPGYATACQLLADLRWWALDDRAPFEDYEEL